MYAVCDTESFKWRGWIHQMHGVCIFIFWIHNVFLGLHAKQSCFCIARIKKAVHNSEFGSFMYLNFSWIKVYFYHITYLCIMIFNLTFQALDPNFRNQNFWRDTILNFDTRWKIVTVTCNTYYVWHKFLIISKN